MSRGHSEGRKEQAISRAFACQNSDSSSLCFFTSVDKYCSLESKRNRISVETQKYETLRREIFSRKLSLESSVSFLDYESRSFKFRGWICMMFPMFKEQIHSF